MSIILSIKSFQSRIARKKATNGKIRSFVPSAGAITNTSKPGFLNQVWDGLAKFGVSLLSTVWDWLGGFLSWSATAIMNVIAAAKDFVFNYNWNPSDAELDRKISNSFNALPGIVGNVLGKATGYLLCGAAPAALIYSFNEAMGMHVLEELGEEALDEMVDEVSVLIKATFTSSTNAAFLFSHKQIRTLWRETDDKFRRRLEASGLKKKYVEDAINERNKPFIIRESIDKRVEAIESKPLQDFIENFLEEFDSTCIEAGYVIAGGIDSYMAQQSVTEELLKGKQQNVEIEFNEDGSIKLKEYKAA